MIKDLLSGLLGGLLLLGPAACATLAMAADSGYQYVGCGIYCPSTGQSVSYAAEIMPEAKCLAARGIAPEHGCAAEALYLRVTP